LDKTGFNKESFQEFPSIQDKAVQEMNYDRTYGRTNVTQQTLVEGANKAIILNDGVNDRILIGYQKGGF
jgi:hypothetical protein